MGNLAGDLPAQNIIKQGLKAVEEPNAKMDIPALLVSIGAPKLRSIGYKAAYPIPDPEKKLYSLLAKEHPGRSIHSLYNSWIRLLVSFERAAQCVK